MALTLPDLITLSDYEGNWAQYETAVYGRFSADFAPCRFLCMSKRVSARLNPPVQEKSPCFWHLISEGSVEEERTPDLRRCERIAWVRPLIEAAGGPDVRTWREVGRKNDKRLLIATPDFDYVVVTAEKDDHYLLVTAYCVEQTHRQAKLKKQWNDAGGT
jgi:hypothetical protein